MNGPERTPESPRGRVGAAFYSFSIMAAFVLLLLAAIGTALEEADAEAAAAPAPAAAAEEARPDEPPAIHQLACFSCHSFTAYESGSDAGAFPHADHFDFLETSDCHSCHAFSEHEVVIERTVCADCH